VVKRDDDLIRQLLFEFEADDDWLILMPGDTNDSSEEDRKKRYYMLLLADEGMLAFVQRSSMRMTSQGHDMLDAIRSDTIWKRAKDGAASVGGVTLGMLKDLAVAYLKKEASERLGITLS
jgi:hypothetical protein